MKLSTLAVPFPSLASVVISLSNISEGLKMLTLAVGLVTSVVMFLAWLSKRRRDNTEENLSQLKLQHEQLLVCMECLRLGGLIGGVCKVENKLRPKGCPNRKD